MRSKTTLLCITVMLQGLVHQSLCRIVNGSMMPRMDLMSVKNTASSTEASDNTTEETWPSFSTSRAITSSYSVSRATAAREIPARQSVTESAQQLKQAVQEAAKGGVVDVITTATQITNTTSSLSKSFVDLVHEQMANVETICKRKIKLASDALNTATAGKIALMDGITDLSSWSLITGKNVAMSVGSGIATASKGIANVPGRINSYLRGS